MDERNLFYISKFSWIIKDIKIVENINEDNIGNFCTISILKRTVSVNNCEINLSFLTLETKNILPIIYAENSTVIVENTSWS